MINGFILPIFTILEPKGVVFTILEPKGVVYLLSFNGQRVERLLVIAFVNF